MAKKITNIKQLESALDKVMNKALDSASEDIEFIISDFLKIWYEDYHPIVYQRTTQFLKSCTRTKVSKRGSVYHTEIYINYLNMHHEMKEKDEDGNYIKRPLTQEEEYAILKQANIAQHGIRNSKQGISGVRFWDDAMDDIKRNDRLINGFYDYLRSRGFNVTFIQEGGVSF